MLRMSNAHTTNAVSKPAQRALVSRTPDVIARADLTSMSRGEVAYMMWPSRGRRCGHNLLRAEASKTDMISGALAVDHKMIKVDLFRDTHKRAERSMAASSDAWMRCTRSLGAAESGRGTFSFLLYDLVLTCVATPGPAPSPRLPRHIAHTAL